MITPLSTMRKIATALIIFVSLEHLGFLIMEMFFWQTPFVQKVFGVSPELAAESGFMAANQGLYNGFLSIGLLWGLVAQKKDVILFFLLCVIVAGIFGAITVKPTVFVAQSVPAIMALILSLLSAKDSKY
ncbi:DUF1304 domain-containing protein [Puniceicoccaceae bacterium K14]|nr:DUF1304 domain-containing protein [Puniceicoccaceae bacterium K14]